MPILLWDASALVKFFIEEGGSETAAAIFAMMPRPPMWTTFWGYAETYAILVRKHNEGRLNDIAFYAALSALNREVVSATNFGLLSIDDETIMNCVSHILMHSINSADAAILSAYLDYTLAVPTSTCVLVASDQRLLRAAHAERLRTLNPETLAASYIPAFFDALA